MLKKTTKTYALILSTTVFLFLFVIPLFSHATSYQLLEPLPGGEATASSPEAYMVQAFKYLSIMVVSAAVLMLVVGGVEYTVSFANEGKTANAKSRIENALIGLVLFLVSYLVLYTINPNLVTFKLASIGGSGSCSTINGGTIAGGNGGNGGGGTTVAGGTGNAPSSTPGGDEATVRAELAQYGILINHTNPCVNGQTTGCTNVAGLGTTAIDGLVDLKRNCSGCEIMVSGGTEGGHGTHGVGMNQVDLRKNSQLDNFISTNAKGSPVQTSIGKIYTMENGDRYLDETGGDPHWHVYYENQP